LSNLGLQKNGCDKTSLVFNETGEERYISCHMLRATTI